ncbi:hypothetical protein [Chryseolinea serpens]|uniref:hypothetical protein n=1 Tax=Chryseolinea serpens TaxID=947013 RepID=UPI00116142A0|nr:hypothetical protein [Chryseolinea serpens]
MDFLNKPGIHHAVKRNTLRLLQYIELPKRLQGRVADLCFQYLQGKGEPIAVKAFSLTVLQRILEEQPELGSELKIIIEDQLAYASPAFRSRAMKVLKVIG